MRLRDPRTRHEGRHREPSEGHDDRRIEHLELATQIRRAGRDLVGLRVAIVRRPAFDDVGDEHVLAPPADRGQQLHEQVAGTTDERPALAVLVEAGALADEDDLGLRVALAWDRPRARGVQPAVRADPDLRGDGLERDSALDVGHAVASAAPGPTYGLAPRDAAGRTQSRSRRISASSTVFVAAPLRRLSETTQKARPRPSAIEASRRTRPTKISSRPAASVASG